MTFRDREEAGELLSERLSPYKEQEVMVYAIPRGGLVPAVEIARKLRAPLDLVITRKIGHPTSPEYAIAAVSENGFVIGDKQELARVNMKWFKSEVKKELAEADRRRKTYLGGEEMKSPYEKIAILVDDGIATGWTLKTALRELREYKPRKIIIAIPVVPKSIYENLLFVADDVIALEVPSNDTYLGAVGMYYDDFSQVSDQEVVEILTRHKAWLASHKKNSIYWTNRVR